MGRLKLRFRAWVARLQAPCHYILNRSADDVPRLRVHCLTFLRYLTHVAAQTVFLLDSWSASVELVLSDANVVRRAKLGRLQSRRGAKITAKARRVDSRRMARHRSFRFPSGTNRTMVVRSFRPEDLSKKSQQAPILTDFWGFDGRMSMRNSKDMALANDSLSWTLKRPALRTFQL